MSVRAPCGRLLCTAGLSRHPPRPPPVRRSSLPAPCQRLVVEGSLPLPLAPMLQQETLIMSCQHLRSHLPPPPSRHTGDALSLPLSFLPTSVLSPHFSISVSVSRSVHAFMIPFPFWLTLFAFSPHSHRSLSVEGKREYVGGITPDPASVKTMPSTIGYFYPLTLFFPCK